MTVDGAKPAEVRAINCTACGGTLDVLGGHRVKSLTCGYCGSVMDRHADFELIERHRDHPDRPASPLSLGMQATLKGVPFTIIGMIEYVSHQSGAGWAESYDWISFQLYSPTHGYAWLTWNKGHYLFSYRTRELPEPSRPGILAQKMSVRLEGRAFQVFESYPAEIAYVEGEFTWTPKRGDKVHVVEAIDPPFLFSYEEGAHELEYSIGEYFDAEDVHAAFDIDPPRPPDGIHPAQPYEPGPLLQALGKVAPIFAAVAFVGLLLVFVFGGGRELVRYDAGATRGAQVIPFTVGNADQLLELELNAPVTNNWVYYDVEVKDVKADETVLFLGKEISYYEGRDSDGRWTEGSRRARALFKVPATGDYQLEITPAEAGGEIPALTARLYEQVLVKRYMVTLLILSALAFVVPHFHRHRFEKKRWADVLEDDDDD
ncbi:MAG: DUF4178 domain-containing protein [Alphaproteobacteria bacterium]|nr:DUF4178 domain-containing protein [Alphaproteobacteria bacterium]